MKKWVISALVYLVVVVGAYYAYSSIAGEPTDEADHSNMQMEDK
ncbi:MULTISPECIES: hypothetical protein [Robertmurraya]|uniref:Uncharacterized protein n=1 Tax=Robertmurraya beringensis TaxID=641660 RepID=A0ABV6KVN7_9BACI